MSIASFNDSPNEEASDEEHFLQPGDSPVFLTTLYFVNGFAKSYYNDMFNFMMQDNPHVGKGTGTFGQLAPWGPERCYVMHSKLRELENGGFKKMKEFKRYVRALNGIGDDNDVGQDFYAPNRTQTIDRWALHFTLRPCHERYAARGVTAFCHFAGFCAKGRCEERSRED